MSKTSYEVVVKSITWFILLDQVRKQATDAEDLLLADNIRQYGILQPLGARHDGKLVWGHRRLRAAIAAGLKEVPTVVLHKDMTEGEYLTLQMLENVSRIDLKPIELWEGCVRLLEANKGWQFKDLAKALSLDPGQITRIMSPSKAIPAVVEALRAESIPLASVYAITKGDSAEEQTRLLSLALSGMGRDGLEKEVKKSRTVKDPAVKLARIRCPLNSGAVVVVSGPEMDLETYIQALSSALDMARKSSRDSLDIKTAERVWKDRSKVSE